MKKSIKAISAVSVLFLILSLATLTAATTATQNVTLTITPAYEGVAAIRVFDGTNTNPTVAFSASDTGTYTVSVAGAEATAPSYSGWLALGEKDGGSLQYTVAGYTDPYKITVHSGTTNYATGSLYVQVGDPQDDTGTAIVADAHGIVTTSTDQPHGDTNDNNFYIPQGSESAREIINSIPGADTATGTTKNTHVPGAPVVYGFVEDPAVTTVAVTYTIVADPIG